MTPESQVRERSRNVNGTLVRERLVEGQSEVATLNPFGLGLMSLRGSPPGGTESRGSECSPRPGRVVGEAYPLIA